MNSRVITPDSGIRAGDYHNSCLYACQSWQSRCQTFILPSTYLFQASCPISLYLYAFSYSLGANNSVHLSCQCIHCVRDKSRPVLRNGCLRYEIVRWEICY